ncbi:MAG TPA: hypothetical protein VHQ65_00185 [Thermoanaerobaculia bacterium]|nr:hypothetical protein [Thermoanaerobaculia bacterium]
MTAPRNSPFLRCLAAFAAAFLLLMAPACARDAADPAEEGAETGTGETRGEAAAPLEAGEIQLAGDTFHPGQAMVVRFRLEQPAPQGAWLGLIPADVTATDEPSNDAADVTWTSLPEDTTQGTVELEAQRPGRYRVRLFSADDESGEMLSETPIFEVTPWARGDEARGPRLVLRRDGEELTGAVPLEAEYAVAFELPQELPESAWIGIVPVTVESMSEEANDAEDVDWAQVQGTSGQVKFIAAEPGEYVARLFPCDSAHCEGVAEAGPFRIGG